MISIIVSPAHAKGTCLPEQISTPQCVRTALHERRHEILHRKLMSMSILMKFLPRNRDAFRWQPALSDTPALAAHKLRANNYS